MITDRPLMLVSVLFFFLLLSKCKWQRSNPNSAKLINGAYIVRTEKLMN
uniref:Uncharacterized protein n=1 Tax=Setaria viridis TaxID=4556 RepID=A0A4U6VLQ6_SETVI|nr:hypothetical protein SEVIR_3G107250v2 [Setaria viridis]